MGEMDPCLGGNSFYQFFPPRDCMLESVHGRCFITADSVKQGNFIFQNNNNDKKNPLPIFAGKTF